MCDIQSDDTMLILSQNDLVDYKHCQAKTKKGVQCKNKPGEDKHYCSFHMKQFKFQKPDECPICYESLQNETQPLSCGHWLHRKCFLKTKKNTCPICRSIVKMSSKEYRHTDIPTVPILLDHEQFHALTHLLLTQALHTTLGSIIYQDD